ncbi:MAG: hypothetical protein ACOVNU_04230 [Candidatus Kapaibacteriota bacterium]
MSSISLSCPVVPPENNCSGSATFQFVNEMSALNLSYTIPTDGVNTVAVCTITASPLPPNGGTDSFVGSWTSGYYTFFSGVGIVGKTIRVFENGVLLSSTTINASPYQYFGSNSYTGFIVVAVYD